MNARDTCLALHKTHYLCLLPKGHDGPHGAGPESPAIARWYKAERAMGYPECGDPHGVVAAARGLCAEIRALRARHADEGEAIEGCVDAEEDVDGISFWPYPAGKGMRPATLILPPTTPDSDTQP